MKTTYTPNDRLFIVLSLMALVAVGCFVWDVFALIWLGMLILIGMLTVFDWAFLRQARMRLEGQTVDHQPTVQRPFRLSIFMQAEMPKIVRFSVEAIESDILRVEEIRPKVAVDSNNRVTAQWDITAKERGNYEWPGTVIGYRTPLGLVTRWQTLEPVPIKIFPKINANLQTLFNPSILLEQLGVKNNRNRRSDQVFESLRPYLIGDNYRHIDWKASARTSSLITRQFQMEQHHNILLCLDSSRLMGTLTEGISKLDWAIEACMHMAYLADYLKDNIGLVVFSSHVDKWVKPQRHSVEAFLNTVYDVKSTIVEADLNSVCANILATQKKRSLVIFLSDFIDASSMQPFLPSFSQLNRKHCGLFVGIDDPAYKRYLSAQELPDTSLDIARRIVAQDSMNRRENVLQQLRKLGLHAINSSPENLIQRTVNAYLEIKLAGAI